MNNLVSAMGETSKLESIGKSISRLEEAEKHELIRELLSPHLNTMFVTPKDIDESVKRLSYTISEGINMAFFPL
jgi:spore protease